MTEQTDNQGSANHGGHDEAGVITGPISGIEHRTALELAKHGTLVLVARSPDKLAEVKRELDSAGTSAVCVVCDLAEPASVRRAVAEIVALKLPIAGVFNNAGVRQKQATQNSVGWDSTFATNHLGTFLFTELLLPHLRAGADVVKRRVGRGGRRAQACGDGRLPRRSLPLR